MTIGEASTAGLAHSDRFFVGGSWVEPSSAGTFEVINPSSGERLLRVPAATETDMSAAIASARAAFDHGPWPRLSHAERAEYLCKIAAEIRRRGPELAALWSGQVGVLLGMSSAVSALVADVFDYYAGLADTFAFVERHAPTAGGEVALLVREPVGVVAAIIPWNGPLGLIAYKTAPALLAGCSIVVKPSPEAPGEAYVFAEIAAAVGLPDGVVNVVTADRDVSELLVRDPRIDKVTFTGSTAAGRRIASIVGERIGRYTLELGGKSSAVVLDDYDVEDAAGTLMMQVCMMTGQNCSALTRVIVSAHQHDALIDALSAASATVRVGDPSDAASGMGPLAGARQRERVEGYIAKGVAEGALLAAGGRRPAGLDHGFFIEPTVFARVPSSATIAQEEIFGPVLSVIPADDESHAVELANDTIYGLNSAVFTNDVDRAYSVARGIRAGTVGHNGFRVDFGIAFGGFKQSGVGREGGTEGLLPFLETKTIVLDGLPAAVGHLTTAPSEAGSALDADRSNPEETS